MLDHSSVYKIIYIASVGLSAASLSVWAVQPVCTLQIFFCLAIGQSSLGGSSWRRAGRQEGGGWKCFSQRVKQTVFFLHCRGKKISV